VLGHPWQLVGPGVEHAVELGVPAGTVKEEDVNLTKVQPFWTALDRMRA
jgi:hypothetical protein